MSALPIREKIVSELEKLSERELEAVLRYVEVMQSMRLADNHHKADDEHNDPLVGFIAGPTDLAERSQEILRAELGLSKAADIDQE